MDKRIPNILKPSMDKRGGAWQVLANDNDGEHLFLNEQAARKFAVALYGYSKVCNIAPKLLPRISRREQS